jgi:hypothetical protein
MEIQRQAAAGCVGPSNPSRSSAPSGVNRESAPVDKGCSVPDLDADALIHAIPALVLDDLFSTPSLEAVCVVPRQDCVNGGKKWLVYCQIGLTMLSCVLGGTLIYGWVGRLRTTAQGRRLLLIALQQH